MYNRIIDAQANMSKGKNDEAAKDAPETNGDVNGAATQLETAKKEVSAVAKGTKTGEAELA